ncbi:hypothetical protein B0H19DRAFT_1074774 [Mycena capillaripes]|nr:hypothetical protein B0H19DRAFT_1074774 [Mycena capillaripes]
MQMQNPAPHQERLGIHAEEEIKKKQRDRNENEPVPPGPRCTDAASSASRPLYHLPRTAAQHYLRRRGRSLVPQAASAALPAFHDGAPTILLAQAHVAPPVFTSTRRVVSPKTRSRSRVGDSGGGDTASPCRKWDMVGKVMISLRGSGARWWTYVLPALVKEGRIVSRSDIQRGGATISHGTGRKKKEDDEGRKIASRKRGIVALSRSLGAGMPSWSRRALEQVFTRTYGTEYSVQGSQSPHESESGTEEMDGSGLAMVYNGREGKVPGKGSDGALDNLLEKKFKPAGASWCASRHRRAHLDGDAVRVVWMACHQGTRTERTWNYDGASRIVGSRVEM